MLETLLVQPDDAPDACPIHVVEPDGLGSLKDRLGDRTARWIDAAGFAPEPGAYLLVPDASGDLEAVVVGAPRSDNPFAPLALGSLVRALPEGRYALAEPHDRPDLAALGWLLGAYRFDRYKSGDAKPRSPSLVLPDGADADEAVRIAQGCAIACDLINTPACDMGPEALAAAAADLADEHGATCAVTVGDALLDANLSMIHAVGRAGPQEPRLVDIAWGDEADPRLTLVGKGITFDTGGLDLKPPSAMALMKKDMGGAANVLGLASMIMDAGLPVRLRVLLPIAENSVAGTSFRPGDVLTSRKGITVEIGNTDAEGRLVLADALTLADADEPDLMIDLATLTGAARVALGPDLPPFYTHDDAAAAELAEKADGEADPLWRMPLWPAYKSWLKNPVADITNAPEKPFAGSVTAALFLDRFVEQAKVHIHADIYGWTPEAKPHAARGGAAQGIRALYAFIAERYRS